VILHGVQRGQQLIAIAPGASPAVRRVSVSLDVTRAAIPSRHRRPEQSIDCAALRVRRLTAGDVQIHC
jgi:hypothetical protein